MRYALVSGVKREPQSKLKGLCSNCGAELIAKCGRVNVWHWAHKNKVECDPWWESETIWHREWKQHFPVEWQEVSHVDPLTEERHIADVKSPFDLVIELQHSAIKYEERKSREYFYKDMIWIVDGTRGSSDKSYFNMGLSRTPLQQDPVAYQIDWWGRSKLLENWADSEVKVYFDFGTETLWRLLFFDKERKKGAVAPLTKEALINDCLRGNKLSVMNLK